MTIYIAAKLPLASGTSQQGREYVMALLAKESPHSETLDVILSDGCCGKSGLFYSCLAAGKLRVWLA